MLNLEKSADEKNHEKLPSVQIVKVHIRSQNQILAFYLKEYLKTQPYLYKIYTND